MSVTVAQLNAIVGVDDRSLITGLNRAGQYLNGFASKSHSAMQMMSRGFNTAATDVIGSFGASVKEAAKFQKHISDIGGNTTLTTKELAKLGDVSKSMSVKTGASIYDVSTAFMHATNLSYGFSDSQKIVDAALKSALSTGTKVADVTRTLAQVMRESNIPISKAAEAMDALHVASANSTVKLEDFAHHGTKAFAIAGTMGLNFQETGTVLATLTKHGFPSASLAATQFAGMIAKITGPSKGAQKELAALSRATGIDLVKDFSQAGLQSKGVVGVLKDLQAATHGNYGELQKLIPATRGGLGAFALMTTGMKDLDATMRSVQHGAGSTAVAFARQQATYQGQLDKLNANLTVLKVTMGTALLPISTKFATALGAIFEKFNSLPKGTQQTITKFVEFAAIGLGIVAIVGKVLIGISSMVEAFKILKGALSIGSMLSSVSTAFTAVGAVLTGPVLLAIGAAVLAVGGLYLAWTRDFGHIREVTRGVIAFLQPYIATALTTIKGLWTSSLGQIVAFVKTNLPLIQASWKVVSDNVMAVVKWLSGQISAIFNGIVGFLMAHSANIKAIINAAWSLIADRIRFIVTTVLNVVKLGMQLLTGDWKGAWKTVCTIVEDALKQAISVLKNAWIIFKNVGTMLIEGLIAGIKGAAGLVGGAIGNMVHGAIDTAKTALGIASPSRVFHEMGTNVARGFHNGIRAGHAGLSAESEKIIHELLDKHGKHAKKHVKHIKTEMEKEVAAFAATIRSTRSELASLQGGGDTDDEKLAKRFRLIPQGQRNQLSELMGKIGDFKERQQAVEQYGRSIKDLQIEIRKARTNNPFEQTKAANPFLSDAQIKTLVNYQKTLEVTQAHTKAVAAAQKHHATAVLELTKAIAALTIHTEKVQHIQTTAEKMAARFGITYSSAAKDVKKLVDTYVQLKTQQETAIAQHREHDKTVREHDATTTRLQKRIEEYRSKLNDLHGTTTQQDHAVKQSGVTYERLDDAQKRLLATANALQKQWETEIHTKKALETATKQHAGLLLRLSEHLAKVQIETNKLGKTESDNVLIARSFGVEYAKAAVDVKALIDRIVEANKHQLVTKERMQAAAKAAQDQAAFTRSLREQLAQLNGRIYESTHGLKAHETVLRQLGFDYSLYSKQMQNMTADQKKLLAQIMENFRRFKAAELAQEQMRKLADGTKQMFEGLFQDLFHNGFKGFFNKVIQGFEDMLAKMAEQYLASQLTQLLVNALGGAFGGASTGNGLGMPGRAIGGPIDAGRPYLVGERGPEIVVPRNSGTVLPNNAIGGGRAVHIVFNISTPDVAGFRRSQGQIASEAHAAFSRQAMRNG